MNSNDSWNRSMPGYAPVTLEQPCRPDLLLLGLLAGVPALGRHLLVDALLHAQALRQRLVKSRMHVLRRGLDGAVQVEVTRALSRQKQAFHDFLIVHAAFPLHIRP